jgi:hypothetical protein
MEERAGINQADQSGDSKLLSCDDEPESFDEWQDIPLTGDTMAWNRIPGFYNKEDKKFR